MKTVGLPISRKENELRRSIVPEHLANVKNCGQLYFEKGYGEVLGYSDADYEKYGVMEGVYRQGHYRCGKYRHRRF